MSFSRSGRSRLPEWMMWLVGAAVFLAAAILLFSVVLGIRAGQRQLEIQTRQQVGIHLQQAIDLRAEGRLEEALAEYQQVLMLEPGNVAAVEGIESLFQLAAGSDAETSQNTQPEVAPAAAVDQSAAPEAPTAGPTPAPTPAPDTPTPPPEEAMMAEARAAYTAGRWEETAEILLELQRESPDYAPDAVVDMLFNTYVNLAAAKDQDDNLEEALAYVDKALELRPDVEQLRTARTMAAQYLDALGYSGADWARAVSLLEELYAEDPSYRDVEERLPEALVAYGDALMDEEDYCLAREQYISAIDLDVSPGLIAKRDAAAAECDEPLVAGAPRPIRTPTRSSPARSTATATNATDSVAAASATDTADAAEEEETPTPEPATATAGDAPRNGSILYAASSPDDRRSRIFRLAVGTGAPQMVVEDGTQPAMRPDGQRLVYYNTRDDMAGISSIDPGSGLQLRFTKYAEDQHPSWNPEGNRIAFASNREGDRRWRIYVAWADVDGEVNSINFGEAPAWHPQADRIAFRGCDETGNRCGIWTMSGGGAGAAPVTTTPADTFPAWSPDGLYLYFTSNSRDGNYEVYRIEVESGDVLRLTDNPANDGKPTASPDGAWVAFLSDREGSWAIWAVPAGGGEAVKVGAIDGLVGNWLEQSIQWID